MGDPEPRLEWAREAWQRHAWREAHDAFVRLDGERTLGPTDLRMLAVAAYMLGRDDDYVAVLERVHREHLARRRLADAAREAFWIGHSLLFRGRGTLARGWFATGRRLVAEHGTECPAAGYLNAPEWLERMGRGDWEGAVELTETTAAMARRLGDADLGALARDDQARALVALGRVGEGQRLADELLVEVSSEALSPVVSGIVYCNTIAFCREAHLVPAAHAWTDALTAWCQARPEMVAHLGLCLVHRAEMLQLRGNWDAAAAEADVAAERFTLGALNQIAVGQARYRRGEVHRLRGEWNLAEECYRDAARLGCDPQPGMSLLRLGQGRRPAAAAAIRRAVTEQTDPLRRAGLLPSYVEVMLACDDREAARTARDQLAALVADHPSDFLAAALDQCSAAVELADGEAEAGLRRARSAYRAWVQLDAPYEAARSRLLVADACRALGDTESAELELHAAAGMFESLGALPELAGSGSRESIGAAHGLSGREVEVLQLVARGLSNRDIADQLVISEHTVARHLQNIFVKLDVRTRSAAGAFAFDHGLA